MKFPDLNEVLEYKNHAVLKLYEQNHSSNALTAEQAFTELLKYLWISKKHALESQNDADRVCLGFCSTDTAVVPVEFFMPKSMREIDDMWHEFILFTQDYTDFCLRYFGEYIHHLPSYYGNEPMPRDLVARDLVESEVEKLITYIYDNLGAETVSLWYSSYLNEEVNQVKTTARSLVNI